MGNTQSPKAIHNVHVDQVPNVGSHGTVGAEDAAEPRRAKQKTYLCGGGIVFDTPAFCA